MAVTAIPEWVSLTDIETWSKHAPTTFEVYAGGPHYTWRFENGYGASLISNSYSHGCEMAVLRFWGDDHKIDYGTSITMNVLGDLTPQEIEDNLDLIKALKTKEAS